MEETNKAAGGDRTQELLAACKALIEPQQEQNKAAFFMRYDRACEIARQLISDIEQVAEEAAMWHFQCPICQKVVSYYPPTKGGPTRPVCVSCGYMAPLEMQMRRVQVTLELP